MENMELKIAVCEDCPEDAKLLSDYIKKSFPGSSIELFDSGEKLISAFVPDRYHLIFFDIYLKGITGIQAAQMIRTIDEDCEIVFTTVSREHTLEGYDVFALSYLLKPVQPEDINKVIRRYLQKHRQDTSTHTEEECLIIKNKRKILRIPLSKIEYIEADNKKCRLHLGTYTIDTYMGIGQLTQLLPAPPFLHCHRSYIVNMEHVLDMNNDFTMKSGIIVYIRQSDHKRIRETYLNYLIQKEREYHHE